LPAGPFAWARKAERAQTVDCAGTLRRVSQSGVARCLPPRSKAAGAATARLRLGVIMAVALLAGCATRVEVTPIHKSQFITKGASFQVTRLWWTEDSLNRKVVHRHNLG